MAVIAVQPFTLKDCDLQIKLGTTAITAADPDYAGHTSRARFDPSSSSSTWTGLKPDASFTDQGPETWALSIALAQDWETPSSLSRFLFDNAGKTASIRLRPRSGSGPSFDATVTLTAPAIGGDTGQVATSDVTLGVSGRPKLVPAA